MCYFITVGVPKDGAACLEDAIPRGMAAFPSVNTSITRRLPQGYQTYVITSGMCSCGLFCRSSPSPLDDESETSRLRRKYEKLGWSKTKVERVLAQASSKPRPETFEGLRPDLRELLAGIAEEVGELAVVGHFYNGEIETEKFTVREGPTVTPESLRAGDPALIEDQVLFVNRKRPGRARIGS